MRRGRCSVHQTSGREMEFGGGGLPLSLPADMAGHFEARGDRPFVTGEANYLVWHRATGLPSGSATAAIRSPHGMSSASHKTVTFASINPASIDSRSST